MSNTDLRSRCVANSYSVSVLLCVAIIIAAGCNRSQGPDFQSRDSGKPHASSVVVEDQVDSSSELDSNPAAEEELNVVESPEKLKSESLLTDHDVSIVDFQFEDSFCKEILASPTIEEFKELHPQVRIDRSRGDSKLGLDVYRDVEFFSYSFMDGILLQSTFTLLRSQESSSKTIQKYEDGLGKPTSTDTPDKFRRMPVNRYRRWEV